MLASDLGLDRKLRERIRISEEEEDEEEKEIEDVFEIMKQERAKKRVEREKRMD